MGDTGATQVAEAFIERKRLRRGNARTDGQVYYLFGKPIARHGAGTPDLVHALLRDEKPPVMLTWAGWPTQSTARHLNAVCRAAGRRPRAQLMQSNKVKTALWRSGHNDDYYPADTLQWFDIRHI